MMKRISLLVAAIVAVFVLTSVSAAVAQDDVQDKNLSEFMRAKLSHSQKVLEGLATADYDMITKSAQELSLLSRAAEWQVVQTADYAQHSNDFRRAADELTEAARNKNLDGATLSYVKMTMKCVECHKYVHKVGEAKQLDWNFDDTDFAASLRTGLHSK